MVVPERPPGPLPGQPPQPSGAHLVNRPVGGPGGLPLPTMRALTAIRRSFPMLRAVRGTVELSIVLGVIVSGLPFVVSAAQGPLTALLGRAEKCGGLHNIWRLYEPFFSRQQGPGAAPERCAAAGSAAHGTGLMHWLATPLPFGVLLAIWAVALVLQQVLAFGRAWADAQVQWRLITDIRQRVHDHLESLSLDFFTGTPSGMLMQRIQMETMSVQVLLSDCLISPAIDSTVLVVALAYMLGQSWQMTLVTLALSPFALMTLAWGGRRLQDATKRMVMSSRQLNGELGETISGISDIQVFDAEERRSERFYDVNKSAARNSSMMLVWAQVGIESTGIFVGLSTALVLIVGVVFSGTGFVNLEPSTLLQFVFLVPTTFAPAQRIIQAYTKYKSTLPQVAATYQLLDTKPSVADHPGAEVLGEVHGNIVFEDVVFGYSKDQKILNGFTTSIEEGETVALVGPIGAGKSTVMNLLLRFLDPEQGRIVLDGHDISQVTLASLREQVSKLSQFPFYLKDTIRENVRLGRQEATDAEVEEACKQALIHSVIIDPAKMPNGYDTVVDVQVPSGGQKRLIALARCLLRKPEVLLLDEPTENLDADERLAITRVIRDYAQDRTCIVISHDMDFIKAVADRIVVLDRGQVAEDGTHEELMSKGGLYKKLHEAQKVDPALVRGTAPPPAAQGAAPMGAGPVPVGAAHAVPGSGPGQLR